MFEGHQAGRLSRDEKRLGLDKHWHKHWPKNRQEATAKLKKPRPDSKI